MERYQRYHEEKAKGAVAKLGSKNKRTFEHLRTRFQQDGDKEAVAKGHALLAEIPHLSVADRERLSLLLEQVRINLNTILEPELATHG